MREDEATKAKEGIFVGDEFAGGVDDEAGDNGDLSVTLMDNFKPDKQWSSTVQMK